MTNPRESSSEQQAMEKNNSPDHHQNEPVDDALQDETPFDDDVKISDDHQGGINTTTTTTTTDDDDHQKTEQPVEGTDVQEISTTAGAGAGATAGSGSSINVGRKRGSQGTTTDDDVGSSSGTKAIVLNINKKKRELDHVPRGVPTCYVCKRIFGSWKAVFGHLRAHSDRKNRGAFPPPTFTPEGSPERNIDIVKLRDQLAPTLLDLARETMKKMAAVGQHLNTTTAATAPVASSSSSRRIMGLQEIDLNVPTTSHKLDLNNPPPPDNNNGNDNGNGNDNDNDPDDDDHVNDDC